MKIKDFKCKKCNGTDFAFRPDTPDSHIQVGVYYNFFSETS